MVHVCVNGTMQNTNNYSSPIPVIGLYIAAASFICFLLIFCDVWAGFKSKKHWFPCRFFSINSITLSLISIATKLPVDLTTAMPSAQDQLSKLCGTVFICMTMGFMLPSLSINAEFESFANVTALSIFVCTVVVNICIQLATGVIFSFNVEHVIIMVCMLLLLIRFWSSVAVINGPRGAFTDGYKKKKILSERLKACYLSCYVESPQLLSSWAPDLGDNALVCILCSVVLIEAMFRSLGLKDINFCNEVSDYGWSMWLVVGSQVLTVAVVSLAIGIRWLTFLPHSASYDTLQLTTSSPYFPFKYFLSIRRFPKFLEKSFRYVIYAPLTLVNISVMASHRFVQTTFRVGLVKCGILNADDKDDFGWVRRKGQEDMERWMEINRKASLEHLTNLLSTVHPSQESSSNIGLTHGGTKVSSLSMILLVEVAKIVMRPTPRNKVSLAKILDETFDIIYFIDRKLNVGSLDDRVQSMLAHIIHQYGLPTGVPDMILKCVLHQAQYNPSIETVCVVFPALSVDAEAAIKDVTTNLADFIEYQSFESTEAVYDRIEQLFVEMLHVFLAQLPVAIFAHVVECPNEEYEERVRLCLGLLCKVESLKTHIRFSSLPPISGITNLFDTETDLTDTPVEGGTQVQAQSTNDSATAPDVEHGEIQETAPHVTLPVHD